MLLHAFQTLNTPKCEWSLPCYVCSSKVGVLIKTVGLR